MPLVRITYPEGALSQEHKRALASELTAVAVEVGEQHGLALPRRLLPGRRAGSAGRRATGRRARAGALLDGVWSSPARSRLATPVE